MEAASLTKRQRSLAYYYLAKGSSFWDDDRMHRLMAYMTEESIDLAVSEVDRQKERGLSNDQIKHVLWKHRVVRMDRSPNGVREIRQVRR